MTEHQVAALERHILGRAHRALERVLVRIETTAEVAGTLESTGLSGGVRGLLDELAATLTTHMEWEETVCYPESDRLAATPWATRLLRLQHAQIRTALDQLAADGMALQAGVGHRQVADLRAHLYALHATLSSHLEQEERALLTLLVAEPAAPAPLAESAAPASPGVAVEQVLHVDPAPGDG
jgi:iron-sulfur cluster repair protein YtfE (RIC family)